MWQRLRAKGLNNYSEAESWNPPSHKHLDFTCMLVAVFAVHWWWSIHQAKKKFLFLKVEKVFTVQKYTTPNFQNLFFLFHNLDLLKIFLKFLLSTNLHFKTGLKLVWRDFFGKEDLFGPSLGAMDAIILCSLTFNWKQKSYHKKREKKNLPLQ